MKIEEFEMPVQLASKTVTDLPMANLSPLLQSWGRMGMLIRHLSPILKDTYAQRRLFEAIIGHGYSLTPEESWAAEVLGWDKVLLAPAVLDVLGYHAIGGANREIPARLVERCATLNDSSKGKWMLIYCAPKSLMDLYSVNWENSITSFEMYRIGTSPQTKLPDTPWFTAHAEQGYYLINFGINEKMSTPDDDGWNDQERTLKSVHCSRLRPEVLAQVLLTHSMITGELPFAKDPHLWNWAANDESARIFVSAEIRDSQRIIELRSFENKSASVPVMVRCLGHLIET